MGLEAIDALLVKNMKTKHMYKEALAKLPDGNGWLLVESASIAKWSWFPD